jgi:tripartite-type tricarboxylate transporter receptor subunit TctC
MDYAANEQQRQILRLVLSRQTMGWPFVAPPDLPPERKAALRRAFDETMRNPEFLAEAKTRKLDVNPMSGQAVERLIDDIYRTPAAVVTQARSVIAEK